MRSACALTRTAECSLVAIWEAQPQILAATIKNQFPAALLSHRNNLSACNRNDLLGRVGQHMIKRLCFKVMFKNETAFVALAPNNAAKHLMRVDPKARVGANLYRFAEGQLGTADRQIGKPSVQIAANGLQSGRVINQHPPGGSTLDQYAAFGRLFAIWAGQGV